jgi:hypothetical protein
VTDGSLLKGVKRLPSGLMTTESVVMRASSGTVRWVKGEQSGVFLQRVEGCFGSPYFLRRYPVLNTQWITAMQMSSIAATTLMLIPMATSPLPKKVQRKPLMR